MKVISKAIKKNYIFNCPICGSKLEAEPSDFEHIGSRMIKLNCPVCNEDIYMDIEWKGLEVKIVYENTSE